MKNRGITSVSLGTARMVYVTVMIWNYGTHTTANDWLCRD
jgi:hypothetical protein